jgi:hypothetical protein
MSDKTRSILIGAALAAGGAFVGFFADQAADGQFGAYSALIGAVASVLLNVLRKFAAPTAAVAFVAFSANVATAQDCPNGRCPRLSAVVQYVSPTKPATALPAGFPHPMPGPPRLGLVVQSQVLPLPPGGFSWRWLPGIGWGWVADNVP